MKSVLISIVILVTCAGSGFSFKKGEKKSVPFDVAADLVGCGHAEYTSAEEEKKAKAAIEEAAALAAEEKAKEEEKTSSDTEADVKAGEAEKKSAPVKK